MITKKVDPSLMGEGINTHSSHPIECVTSIPFSLSLRIVRVCSEETDREQRFLELKEMLMSRDYPLGVISGAIAKARAIPRHKALLRVPLDQTLSIWLGIQFRQRYSQIKD